MSFKGIQTMDQEKVSFNLAKLKKEGKKFEIAIDADLAIALKNGKDVDIKDVVKSEHIYSDVKKGLIAEGDLDKLFGTEDVLEVAKIIIRDGQIQLTAEHRQKLRDEKRAKIITLIARNGIDPRTKLPHPPMRIENAFAEAKITIDDMRPAEEQIDEIIKKLRPVLPISFEKKKIEIRIPPENAGKAYSSLLQFAKPQSEKWNDDGSFTCVMEIPAGLEADFYEKLNNLTHGGLQAKVLEK